MRARFAQGVIGASEVLPAAGTGAHNAQARGRLGKLPTDGICLESPPYGRAFEQGFEKKWVG